MSCGSHNKVSVANFDINFCFQKFCTNGSTIVLRNSVYICFFFLVMKGIPMNCTNLSSPSTILSMCLRKVTWLHENHRRGESTRNFGVVSPAEVSQSTIAKNIHFFPCYRNTCLLFMNLNFSTEIVVIINQFPVFFL